MMRMILEKEFLYRKVSQKLLINNTTYSTLYYNFLTQLSY